MNRRNLLLLGISIGLLLVHWQGGAPKPAILHVAEPSALALPRGSATTNSASVPRPPRPAAAAHPTEAVAQPVCSAPPPSRLAGVAVYHIQEHAPECPLVAAWRAGRSQPLAPEAPGEAVAEPLSPSPAADAQAATPCYEAVQLRFTEIAAAAEPLALGVQVAEVRLFHGRRRLRIAAASAVEPDGPAAHNASYAADGACPRGATRALCAPACTCPEFPAPTSLPDAAQAC